MKTPPTGEWLRKDLASKIEQLQAAYDAEMLKFMELHQRIAKATKLGCGDAETALLERELDVVQRDRREIGEQISHKLQELSDVDSPTIEEEYVAVHLDARAQHREFSERIVSANRELAKMGSPQKTENKAR